MKKFYLLLPSTLFPNIISSPQHSSDPHDMRLNGKIADHLDMKVKKNSLQFLKLIENWIILLNLHRRPSTVKPKKPIPIPDRKERRWV